MLEHDLDDSIGFWVGIASQEYNRVLTEEIAPHGITLRQCQVLGCLAFKGACSQSELAELIHVEPPTLVGILDRMQRDGWITREICKNDRRRKLITPTSNAEPVWQKILDCGRRVRKKATTGITPEQLLVLKQLLEKVRSNLGQQPDEQHSQENAPPEKII